MNLGCGVKVYNSTSQSWGPIHPGGLEENRSRTTAALKNKTDLEKMHLICQILKQQAKEQLEEYTFKTNSLLSTFGKGPK